MRARSPLFLSSRIGSTPPWTAAQSPAAASPHPHPLGSTFNGPGRAMRAPENELQETKAHSMLFRERSSSPVFIARINSPHGSSDFSPHPSIPSSSSREAKSLHKQKSGGGEEDKSTPQGPTRLPPLNSITCMRDQSQRIGAKKRPAWVDFPSPKAAHQRAFQASVLDHVAAKPELEHHHVECIVGRRRRVPLEVLLDLIAHNRSNVAIKLTSILCHHPHQ